MIYEDFKHFSHEHNLKPECNDIPFICDGCNEPGWGQKFRCHPCNYDLHRDCALAHPTTFHSFYQNCQFTFLRSAPCNKYCNACGRDVHGFGFRCDDSDYDLHPSCANLPLTIKENGIKLRLSDSKFVESQCGLCGNMESKSGLRGWSYISSCKKYHFHVSCVKNSAIKKWENQYFQKIKMDNADMALTVIPDHLQLTSQTDASSTWSRLRKYWKIAKVVLNLIITTVIGDPISGLAALVEYVLSG